MPWWSMMLWTGHHEQGHSRGLEAGPRRSAMAYFRILAENQQARPPGGQLHGQANPKVGPGLASGQQKSSGSSDALPSSSDDE